jgi:ligand-binding sensor domain-containing protein/signal transduction histidine kinase
MQLALAAVAQHFYFRHYQVEDGLSNNTVISIMQDKDGFMWFGTKEGLNRFDGYKIKVFNLDEDYERSLTKDLIYSLTTDQQGTMWVGAQKGLYRYEAEKERFVRVVDTLRDVFNLQADREGLLWFIANHTVCYYDLKARTVKRFPKEQYFKAYSLCLDDQGEIWAGTSEGNLQCYDRATRTFHGYNLFSHSPAVGSCFMEVVLPAGPQTLFVGTSCQGAKQFDIATKTYKDVLTYNADKTTIYVRSMMRYSDTEYWFGTESGIFIMDTRSGRMTNLRKKFLDPYSLSDNAVYSLCKDREGNVWAGTFFGGVNYYAKQHQFFRKYYPDYSKNSISGNAAREICQDHDGNIWIGTEDAGLNKLNPATGSIIHFEPAGEEGNITYSNIHGLMVDGNDLWIGTHEHGLDVLNIKTGKLRKHYASGRRPQDMKSDFIASLLRSSSGRIFIGTGNSLYEYDPQTDGFKQAPEIPPGITISCLYEDRNQTIWAGTHSRGVYYFNRTTNEKGQLVNDLNNRNSLPTDYINGICEDHAGNLWFSTEGGGLSQLARDRKHFTRYTTRNGMPSNYVYKVVEDNHHQLWISTSKGLVCFNPATQRMVVYTKSNGLPTDHFNYNSGFKDADGTLYFGSIKGMVTFRPDKAPGHTPPPPVFITGLQVNNREISAARDSGLLKRSILYADRIELAYNRSSISMDFAALSYISPDMTTYRYMMTGVDENWTTIQPNRKVYYTNLPPGEYVFKVKATVNGAGGEPERQLTIHILPPFWASRLAYLFYALLITGLGFYIIRSYHRRTQKKKEKENFEAKIDFFTHVAHEIRTPLTLIKGPLENLMEKADELPEIRDDILMMDRNTNRLMSLVNHILNFRQIEVKSFSLDFTKVNVKTLLQQTYLDFASQARKKGLDYTIDLPSYAVNAIADEEALQRILGNLLSNAIKYASSSVTVALNVTGKDDDYFTIEISNDGHVIPADMREKIFQPFVRLKETAKQKGTGIGLTVARSLAELHNGKLYLKNTREPVNIFVLQIPLKIE